MTIKNTHRRLLEAVAFAACSHDGQRRKDGQTPYVSHVFRVSLIVRHIFGVDDDAVLAAALLHDTIEDTTVDFDDLEVRFGPDIATWVANLSKDSRMPEQDRESTYLDQLRAAPWQVHICKLADIFDNLNDSLHLPVPQRAGVVRKAEAYLEALQSAASEETSKAIDLVGALLAEIRDAK